MHAHRWGSKGIPTAVVDLDTPYFRGKTKVLCMETPLQYVIIGNVPMRMWYGRRTLQTRGSEM